MLIDKIREIESDIKTQINRNDGYVAVQMNARDALEMAQVLIAVDDILKGWEADMANFYDGSLHAKEIRKAMESTQEN